MWAYRILIAGIATFLIISIPVTLIVLFGQRPIDPSDLASCFKITIPPSVQVVETDVPAPDHTNYYFQISNCSESFYQELLAHSYQLDDSAEEQRTRALENFTYHNLDVPRAGPRACEANFVGVASYSASMLYSPQDKQAVIFIDTY